MKHTVFLWLLGMFLLSPLASKAQQDAQFTHFYFNQLYFNPAYAGVPGSTQFTLLHRTQWLAYQPSFDDGGAPSTQIFSFNTYVPKFNSGIAAYLVRDQLGPLTNFEAQLSYAYHISMARGAKLSLGIRGGLYSQTIAFDRLRFRELGDPFDMGGRDNALKPDLSAGIYYNHPRFFVGLSSTHLIGLEFNFGVVNRAPLANGYYLVGGYHWDVNPQLRVTPTFLMKSSEFRQNSIELGAIGEFSQKFWAGASYRDQESLNLMAGVIFPNKDPKKSGRVWRLGYSFDYVFLGQNAKQPTSHEIMLSYTLPVKAPLAPAPIRSPRFRY